MTAVETNPKGPRHSTSHQSSPNIQYPAIAYFIVFRQTDTCDENKIFTLFHNEDTQVSIQAIATRAHKDPSQVMENASRQLFQVVKDHNNVRVMNMVNASNLYCLRNSALSESEDVDEPVRPLYPTCPCRLVVVNCTEFDVPLNQAMTKLKSDGMTIEIESALTPQIDGACLSSTTEELSATIRKIAKVMEMSKHGLHRATVYAKPVEATATYVRMMDVESYLNKLLVNEALRPKILKNYTSLVRTLSHPACEIIKQLQFDVDLTRCDKEDIGKKVNETNNMLKAKCLKNNIAFLDNSNIGRSHLNSRGLHLNKEGTSVLQTNILQFLNSYN